MKAALDLRASVTRVLDDAGEAIAFAPLDNGAADWTLERALATARARSGRLTSVGVSAGWAARVERHADHHPGVELEHVPLLEALHRLGAGSAGVVVAEGVLGDTVAAAPALGGRRRLVATGWLSPDGPALFAPVGSTTSDHAGQGVADPSPMLLATALMLSEGLGRTTAGQALEESLAAALRGPRRPVEVAAPGVAATTREFVDAVLGLLPSARRDPSSRWESGREDDRRRRDPPGARGRGRRGDVRHPGGAIMPTYDAMARGTTVRHVLARHEQGAGHMAQGYARASGKVGVAIATSGPGATNLVTPIADAWMDSTRSSASPVRSARR